MKTFQVSHGNYGFHSKVLESNLDNFGLTCPRNIILGDSFGLMQKLRNKGEKMGELSLKSCTDYFFPNTTYGLRLSVYAKVNQGKGFVNMKKLSKNLIFIANSAPFSLYKR